MHFILFVIEQGRIKPPESVTFFLLVCYTFKLHICAILFEYIEEALSNPQINVPSDFASPRPCPLCHIPFYVSFFIFPVKDFFFSEPEKSVTMKMLHIRLPLKYYIIIMWINENQRADLECNDDNNLFLKIFPLFLLPSQSL